jgi:plasmid stabilization system protein ParE
MAEVIWAEPALNDLDSIADYIALDNPEAARRLVRRSSSMSIILKAILNLAQSRKSSKAGVIARSSSRRVASSTAKILGESSYFM